ncbi:hypothetical protein BHM03_00049763, partial [Ensete ventricosum]
MRICHERLTVAAYQRPVARSLALAAAVASQRPTTRSRALAVVQGAVATVGKESEL